MGKNETNEKNNWKEVGGGKCKEENSMLTRLALGTGTFFTGIIVFFWTRIQVSTSTSMDSGGSDVFYWLYQEKCHVEPLYLYGGHRYRDIHIPI